VKSPIKNNNRQTKSLSIIKKMIPAGSIIHSHALFDAYLELNLASNQRFVIAHTTRAAIYDFWMCAKSDPERLYLITKEQSTHIINEEIIQTLQKSWYTYADPYLRSALFFLLNRCSQNGRISSGHIDVNGFNPLSLARLRGFNSPNFHLVKEEESEEIPMPSQTQDTDYLLFPIGEFKINTRLNSTVGFEEFFADHRAMLEFLLTEKRKAIILLEYHPAAIKNYRKLKITMVDKSGNLTLSETACQELIIANF
jgi:hypothetical protein